MLNFTDNNYNEFSQENIKLNNGNSSRDGWVNGTSAADSKYTPLNEDNLNTMLNMLIAIKNLIGETGHFTEHDLNSVAISKPTLEGESHISLANYINTLYSAIVDGKSGIQFPANYSLAALKNHIESLNVSDAPNNDDKKGIHKWLSEIEQNNGKIVVKYSQPTIDDISAAEYSNDGITGGDSDDLTGIIDALINKISSKLDANGWEKIPGEDEHGWQLTLGEEGNQATSKISQNGIVIDPVIDSTTCLPKIEVKGYGGYNTTIIMSTDCSNIEGDAVVTVGADGVYADRSNLVDLKFPPAKTSSYYDRYTDYSQIVSIDYLDDKINSDISALNCSTTTDIKPTTHKFITSVTQKNGKISVGAYQPDAKDIIYTAKAAPSQEDEGTIQHALDSKLDANGWLTADSSEHNNILTRLNHKYKFPIFKDGGEVTIATTADLKAENVYDGDISVHDIINPGNNLNYDSSSTSITNASTLKDTLQKIINDSIVRDETKLDANEWLTEESTDYENVLTRNEYSYIFPTDEEVKSLTIATREWVQTIKDNYYTKSEIDSMLGSVSELLAKLHSNKPNGGTS